MPLLDVQRRGRELGRIRLGQKSAKGAPQKLDRFRLTSPSRELLVAVANLYGGTVREWQPQPGVTHYEVVTDATRLPILVPPQPVSQWMELWSGGGCQRRCDQVTEHLSDSPCICAAQDDMQCKPTTRLNVVLRDVPGIGVWRLESHGWNAAAELPGVADFLEQAGTYVPAWLTLHERIVKRDGRTNRFMVPAIDVDITPAALMSGTDTAAPALPPVGALPPLPAGDPWAKPAAIEPAPEPDVNGVTETQLKKIGALMHECGMTDRDQALAYVAAVIGRDIASRNELTKGEASAVIKALETQQAADHVATSDQEAS